MLGFLSLDIICSYLLGKILYKYAIFFWHGMKATFHKTWISK